MIRKWRATFKMSDSEMTLEVLEPLFEPKILSSPLALKARLCYSAQCTTVPNVRSRCEDIFMWSVNIFIWLVNMQKICT